MERESPCLSFGGTCRSAKKNVLLHSSITSRSQPGSDNRRTKTLYLRTKPSLYFSLRSLYIVPHVRIVWDTVILVSHPKCREGAAEVFSRLLTWAQHLPPRKHACEGIHESAHGPTTNLSTRYIHTHAVALTQYPLHNYHTTLNRWLRPFHNLRGANLEQKRFAHKALPLALVSSAVVYFHFGSRTPLDRSHSRQAFFFFFFSQSFFSRVRTLFARVVSGHRVTRSETRAVLRAS